MERFLWNNFTCSGNGRKNLFCFLRKKIWRILWKKNTLKIVRKCSKLLSKFHFLFFNFITKLSIYRIILEDALEIETESGFLVHIGPEGPAKIFPAKDLRQALRLYLDQNRVDFPPLIEKEKEKKSPDSLDIFSLD